MALVNITQTLPQDWSYISEGGSAIVFSYTGPFRPDFTGKVLRLRKSLSGHSNEPRDETIGEQDDPLIAFQETVIAALVPPRYLPDLVSVRLDSEWLAALEVLRNDDRPSERRAKDRIDRARKKGVLATDLIGGADILAIEIKPKWGFMPNTAHLSRETAEIKAFTCRFCMHTHFKFKDGNPPTQYCPLDLYSNEEARMRKAIRDLWNSWMQSDGTLNNMKVFVSGKMIRPSKSCSILKEFLPEKAQVHEALADVLLPFVQTPVLKILSDLQRSLDALDIEGIVKLRAMARLDSKESAVVKRDPSLEKWQDFVASYHSVYRALDHSAPRPEDIDTYLMAYLLSATFKDCSVIFRVHRSDTTTKSSSANSHGVYIIDLDAKSVDRMERWTNLDRQIVDCYRSVTQRKSCIE